MSTITKTVQLKLLPTKAQQLLIEGTLNEYIKTVNFLVASFAMQGSLDKRTTKDFIALIPACLKNQALRDAKSVYRKYRKDCHKADFYNEKHPDADKKATLSILRKPAAIWNNQNYTINECSISFPMWVNGRSKKTSIKAIIPKDKLDLLNSHECGTLRITCKNGKHIAQIAIESPCDTAKEGNVMGVDLGIKVPAVCATDTGKVCFAGNGRKNKYLKRKFRSDRKRLGKAKKLNAIRKSSDKENRIMRDIDHKISRKVVNFAIANNVSTIRMETLSGIRRSASKSRKNKYQKKEYLHTWSFYRLAMFIEYKAALAGIKVEYVRPEYTSKACPSCGKHNDANDRDYSCSCGYHSHRDIVGAINIISAPKIDGNSLSA